MAVNINSLKKWEEVCKRLIERTIDTSESRLVWEIWDEDRLVRPDAVSPFYVANFEDWYILVYKHYYEHVDIEDGVEAGVDVAIELIDAKGKIQWQVPKVPSRFQLIDRIQYLCSNVDRFINDILDTDCPRVA